MYQFISIKVILDNLLEHPMLQDLTLERVVAYTIRFMQLVGMPKLFIEKVEDIEIEEYIALLPCDFISVIQLRDKKAHKAYISTTDSFFMAKDETQQLTYRIQGNILYASIKAAVLELSYKAIPVDEEGYPMIVNNEAFIRALELYIKKQRFTILFDQGKLQSGVYQNIQQEYSWAVGQAQTSLIMPTIDELQSITNMWNTLVPRINDHDFGFKSNNIKEHLKYN